MVLNYALMIRKQHPYGLLKTAGHLLKHSCVFDAAYGHLLVEYISQLRSCAKFHLPTTLHLTANELRK